MGQKYVTMSKKDSWQKNGCLWCDSKADFQANYRNSAIRCCRKKKCIADSRKLTKKLGSIGSMDEKPTISHPNSMGGTNVTITARCRDQEEFDFFTDLLNAWKKYKKNKYNKKESTHAD